MIWLVLVSLLFFLIYWKGIRPLSYWKERNVPCPKTFPFLGTFTSVVLRRKTIWDFFKDVYNEFPDERIVGVFFFTSPVLFIRDLELVKQISIKDFDNFMDRSSNFTASKDTDPILAKNLVSLEGQEWRDMRATLSPSFTSSKMKMMFNLISDCAKKFTKYFEDQNLDVTDIEVKDVVSRFTNDVIATTAFGITVDSLKERENEFFVTGQKLNQFGYFRGFIAILYLMIPPLKKLLKIPILSPKLSSFFQKIVNETIEYREKHNIIRPDMIHLLMEARKGKHTNNPQVGETKKGLTNDDIVAQSLVFFAGGFETVSTLMNFVSYELATNQDVQRKLQEEIDEVLSSSKELTYESVMGMKYLDMVISESLRLWSPAAGFERVCLKDYVVKAESEDEKSFIIEKGTSCMIPVVAFHFNPDFFPEPLKFDPERFSDENKANIIPFTYLPFGAGPRICIAQRFALMETKILFFHILSKFNLIAIEKTPKTIVISTSSPNLSPVKPLWLGLQRRNLLNK